MDFATRKSTFTVDRDPATEEAAIHFDIQAGARARFDGVTLTGKFMKTPESIIHATHWRRGFLLLTFPGWRYATESRVTAGVASVRQDFQKGDHLEAQVTLEKLDYNTDTNTLTAVARDRKRAYGRGANDRSQGVAREAEAIDSGV